MSDELKTPWYVDDFSCIWDDDERPIADFALHRDAAAIVHRVNCHDKLVEALEAAMRIKDLWMPSTDWDEEHENEARALDSIGAKIQAALELAKGGTYDCELAKGDTHD